MRPRLVPSLPGAMVTTGSYKKKVIASDHRGWVGDSGLGNGHEAAQDLTHVTAE